MKKIVLVFLLFGVFITNAPIGTNSGVDYLNRDKKDNIYTIILQAKY